MCGGLYFPLSLPPVREHCSCTTCKNSTHPNKSLKTSIWHAFQDFMTKHFPNGFGLSNIALPHTNMNCNRGMSAYIYDTFHYHQKSNTCISGNHSRKFKIIYIYLYSYQWKKVLTKIAKHYFVFFLPHLHHLGQERVNLKIFSTYCHLFVSACDSL